MNEGAAIFSCHFLCDIKLVSANSHLLNFSYFSLKINSLRTFTIFLSWIYDIVSSEGNPGFPLWLSLIIRLWYLPSTVLHQVKSLSEGTLVSWWNWAGITSLVPSWCTSLYWFVHLHDPIYCIETVWRLCLCLNVIIPAWSKCLISDQNDPLLLLKCLDLQFHLQNGYNQSNYRKFTEMNENSCGRAVCIMTGTWVESLTWMVVREGVLE